MAQLASKPYTRSPSPPLRDVGLIGSQLHPPLPSSESSGMWAAPCRLAEKLEMEKREGGPRKWVVHAVRTKYEPRRFSWLVFHHLSSHSQPHSQNETTKRKHDDTRNHNDTTTSLLSPSCPNASRRWTFQRFQRRFHCFHPPSHPNTSWR